LGFLRYLKMWFWIINLLIDFALLVLWIVIVVQKAWVGVLLAPVFLVVMIAPDVVVYLAIHLRYDTTWYVMTDKSLRIRRGVWIIHETTITFENVQNVKVTQGPIQRAFGISSIVVETAGAGGGGSGGQQQGSIANQGIIEGVGNAHEIRDLILSRMKQSKTAGLGDESDVESSGRPQTGWTALHLATLREIRDEIAIMPG
jgi:membrane protein YdbS with pleckstrin-like domain